MEPEQFDKLMSSSMPLTTAPGGGAACKSEVFTRR